MVKRFGDVLALDGVDLDVPLGTVFGLLGPNGAGKTTMVRILSTILSPDAGRATVLGHDVVTEAAAVRYNIGLAGQYAAIDQNLTGRENLRLIGRLTHLPREQIARRGAELLERFDLTHAADRPSRTYSGGMKRRLDLAAALVHQPPVLFLDEPTTGLDPHSRRELWDMIRELVADKTTVLLTTQYLEEADILASTVAVIDQGRVIALDTPAALKARLGGTVIELGFADPKTAAAASGALGGTSHRPEQEGPLLRIASDDGPKGLMDILRRLDKASMTPVTLTVRQPSLDDVFLALTGHHAEEAKHTEEVVA
ncbi:MAG TPA: ATP-binding cassette domain-containing protein [Actinomycetota bacterium]